MEETKFRKSLSALGDEFNRVVSCHENRNAICKKVCDIMDDPKRRFGSKLANKMAKRLKKATDELDVALDALCDVYAEVSGQAEKFR